MRGTRLPVVDGKPAWPTAPGEYCGPVMGYTGDVPAVFFLKPNARDEGAPALARTVHHVTSPPHSFTEEEDGTLTIRASLGDMHLCGDGKSRSDGWHGWLTRGEWVLA